MAIRFNHTLIACRDKEKAARFLAAILGLPDPVPFIVFMCVELANEVSLDFIQADGHEFQPQHYAFLISESEFDEVLARIGQQGLDYWADPSGS